MAMVTGACHSYQHELTLKIPSTILVPAYEASRMICMNRVCVKLSQLCLDDRIVTPILSQAFPCTAAPEGSSTSSEPHISSMVLLLLSWMMVPLSGPSRDLGPLYESLYKRTVSISSCWRSFRSQQRRWTVGLCCSGSEELRKSKAKGWICESLWGSGSSVYLNSNHKSTFVKMHDLPKHTGSKGTESKG